MVTIEKLNKSYPETPVFKSFNCEFREGITGIIGANGSGKTTLFNCIYGTEPYNGSIKKPKSIFYLPNELYFYPRIRGIEYLEFICQLKGITIDKAKIDALNNSLKLPLTKFAEDYSTGMKKKLGLMAMYLAESDLYLLDEPFNGLDLEGAMICKQIIQSIGQPGKVVLVASHLLESQKEICHSIHHLKDGKIAKKYSPNEFELLEADIKATYKRDISVI